MQRTADSLEDLQNRFESWTSEIEKKMVEATNNKAVGNLGGSQTGESYKDVLTKLQELDTKVSGKIVDLEKNVGASIETLKRLNDDTSKQSKTVFDEVSFIFRMINHKPSLFQKCL